MKYLMPLQFNLKIFRFGWWMSPTAAHDCITRFFCTAKSFYSLYNVFCVRARNVYEDKGKVLTEQRANGRKIVGCYMLRPFAHPVACCWELLRQARCKRKQHCWPTTPNIVGCYMLRPFAHPVTCCWELLRQARCKRKQHCWPTTPNIVGCYMLRPFADPVACCWELLSKKLETSRTFSYVQTDATTPNIVGSSLTWKNCVGLSFSISNPFTFWASKEVY